LLLKLISALFEKYSAHMTYKISGNEAWQQELGRRLQQRRLALNCSQTEIAARAGITRKTITNVETGQGGTLLTLIAILKALELETELDRLVPAPGPSPMQMLQFAGQRRRRATGQRKRRAPLIDADALAEPAAKWTWGTPKA
jgi:putative transcriptional regulator